MPDRRGQAAAGVLAAAACGLVAASAVFTRSVSPGALSEELRPAQVLYVGLEGWTQGKQGNSIAFREHTHTRSGGSLADVCVCVFVCVCGVVSADGGVDCGAAGREVAEEGAAAGSRALMDRDAQLEARGLLPPRQGQPSRLRW